MSNEPLPAPRIIIKTLHVVQNDVEVLLTRQIVRQLPEPRLEPYTRDEVPNLFQVLGTVKLGSDYDETIVLINSPEGLTALKSSWYLNTNGSALFKAPTYANLPRFVLLK